ncbi:hypothetical protein SAMN05421730_1002219 [Anaerobium acetethylicum]|uniref:Uncharacterized protein n=1 Tax=Anaerobium acetethylicum TaxID=1619234 RepID=A0A1D3TQG5_9FIRM|nr:hypothetical protein SAMN05421730_1002219 [Anaerobium acetethylicum]
MTRMTDRMDAPYASPENMCRSAGDSAIEKRLVIAYTSG